MSQSTRRTVVSILSVCALLSAGCIGIDPDARQVLWEPVNCADADQDIPTLEAARPDGVTRFTQGLQAIAPPMVVLSLLRDVYGKPFRSVYLDHWRIAFGSYTDRIDERVADLRRCSG